MNCVMVNVGHRHEGKNIIPLKIEHSKRLKHDVNMSCRFNKSIRLRRVELYRINCINTTILYNIYYIHYKVFTVKSR